MAVSVSGLFLFISGLLLSAWLLPGPRRVGAITLDIHSLLYAAMAIVAGVQSMQFWAFANAHGMHEGILPPNATLHRLLGVATVERGLITAAILLVIGLVLGVLAVSSWSHAAFGLLDPTLTMRLAIPSAVCIVLAFEIAYGVFVLNVLGIRETRPDRSARSLVEQPSA